MRLLIAPFVLVFLFVQCGGNGAGEPAGSDFEASAGAQRYDLKGRVVSVNKEKKVASIAHDEIPGFMEAMTMDFRIREDWVWDVLAEGAEIRAELVVDNSKGEYWLEKPRIVASSVPDKSLPVREDAAIEGKKIIDFSLIGHDGKPVSPADFKGKAWAITFIYTECPLPEFCILMSRNFSDLANRLATDEALKENTSLLSISFDPAKDTPEKLNQYRLGYLGKDSPAADTGIWRLAVGEDAKVRKIADFFGLRYEVDAADKTQFNHSLRTIVVAPDGTIRKVFTGNDWTVDDLLAQLKAALG